MKQVFFLAMLFVGWNAFHIGAAVVDKKPNIVYVLMDDVGQGDVGAYNPSGKIPTPHMDRIANEGMRFTDAHSNSSVCTPTRYGVLTGRYAWRTSLKSGVLNATSPALISPTRMTVGNMLQTKGYRTAVIGKWHLGLDWKNKNNWAHTYSDGKHFTGGPRDLGFDYFYGISASLDHQPYAYLENYKPTQAPTDHVNGSPWPAFWRGGGVAPNFKHKEVMDSITNKAVWFIENHEENHPDKPFFVYFATTGPHTPHTVPNSWIGASNMRKSDGTLHSANITARGDLMAQCDWAVGEILRVLDEKGIADETLIIVTADNGAHDKTFGTNGHTPHMNLKGQKADIFEAGHRVPFVVRWPGKAKAGSVSNEVICLTDFMATAAAAVGFQLPSSAGEDSYSFLPELLGWDYEKPLRPATVHHSLNGTFALRQGEWKLTVNNMGSGGFTSPKTSSGNGTLYNLSANLSEQVAQNKYSSESSRVTDMKNLLNQYKNNSRSAPTTRSDFVLGCLNSTYEEYQSTANVHDESQCQTQIASVLQERAFLSGIAIHGTEVVISKNIDYEIHLLDLEGRILSQVSGNKATTWRVPHLSSLVYLIQVRTKEGILTKKKTYL